MRCKDTPFYPYTQDEKLLFIPSSYTFLSFIGGEWNALFQQSANHHTHLAILLSLPKKGKINKGEQEKRKTCTTDNLRKVSHVASEIPKDEQKIKSPQVFTWGDGEGNCTEAFKRKEGSRVSVCIPGRSLSSNKGNLT